MGERRGRRREREIVWVHAHINPEKREQDNARKMRGGKDLDSQRARIAPECITIRDGAAADKFHGGTV